MDLKRTFCALFFLCCSSVIQALPHQDSDQGIAFVHGTKDHREDANGNYWKTDFIQELSQALPKPENHFVVGCDFSIYMWQEDAAGCVADQLLEFIDEHHISSLTVYTHSNGANVVRWILSNPAYDKRFMDLSHKVRKVIALSPSSGGTNLADEATSGSAFEGNLGWIFGYDSDAIKQQRLGDMLIYNDELLLGAKGRPSLPMPFVSVVGTDVQASPFSSHSYCNGFMLNTALKITQLYLEECSDGFLNCSSQIAAGDVWFYDTEKTDDHLPLSHNQSRHSCFGLDKILVSELAQQGVAP